MKPRHSVCFLALALLFGALAAGAMPIEEAAAPAPATTKAETAASTLADPCASKASAADAKLQIALAPSLAWLSTSNQGLTGKCGACGDSICTGQNVGAICGFDGVFWYACINLYGNSCGAGKGECFCTTSGPY